MLANRPIPKWSILADEDHATGSDHEVMEWEVEVDRQEEAGHERVVGWNLAAMTEEDAKAAEKLWMELAKGRAHLDTECTAEEVEQEAAWCPEAIGNVLDGTAKKIRICTKSKRLWKPTSGKEGRLSEGKNGGDGTRNRSPRRRQNSRSRFDSPRGKCGERTCKTSEGPRYGEQHDTRTLGEV